MMVIVSARIERAVALPLATTDRKTMTLDELGWTEVLQCALAELGDDALAPARVSAAQREHYRLWTEDGEYEGELSGRLRHEAGAGALPVVGDWVAARLVPQGRGATLVACLPRRGVLVRKRVERAGEPQVLAANLDAVFLVTSLNREFNPRRIERALAIIGEGGAQPVLLLSKLDLCSEADRYREQAEAVALGVPVHSLSAHTGAGLSELSAYLQPARTVALIGSSGVGKSTLVNTLLGGERLQTQPIRDADDKGRHTTTTRELFVLPGGALLIDTPGMRELGLWDAAEGVRTAFDDVAQLAAQCRFPDCQHQSEPDCSLKASVAAGTLEPARLQSFLKLQRELAHEERRRDERAMFEHRQKQRRLFRERKRQLRQTYRGK
jgi:ribosome biogenesis GTPase / thiamine phosphate phosphatase